MRTGVAEKRTFSDHLPRSPETFRAIDRGAATVCENKREGDVLHVFSLSLSVSLSGYHHDNNTTVLIVNLSETMQMFTGLAEWCAQWCVQ